MTPRRPTRSQLPFATRLTVALAALLLVFGGLVGLIARQVAAEQEQESLQRLSQGLARHIVAHWPELTRTSGPDAQDPAARAALMNMLMVVNPGVQVYVLDANGRVDAYIGEPGMVREHQVDLTAVRAFLGGAALPLRGTDPMGSGGTRIFSAAMFPPRAGDLRPPGYLYVVLDGRAREQVAAASAWRGWAGVALLVAIGALATLVLGAFVFRRLTLPLRRLAARMGAYKLRTERGDGAETPRPPVGDEVCAIEQAYAGMTERIEAQAAREQQQAQAHRETMASVAHDLRTPLTALHGHLEALAAPRDEPVAQRARLVDAALAQSDKVRRLSQQLFELATLQSTDQIVHRERFNLDELVTDAVQKFELAAGEPEVMLGGEPPGRLECEGDLQLIERALTNLIDNARRHAPTAVPVRVSLTRQGAQARIVVEDAGPGLPVELRQRLEQGRSLRDPPLKRLGGGIGGLGLAIAQRVAVLHEGSLLPLPAPQGGTRICLALPLAR